MDNVKKMKRGEVLVKEGEAVSTIYIVQSGKIVMTLERTGKKLELSTLGVSQVIGEQGILSNARHGYTYEAAIDTKVLEIPVDLMKQQLEKTPPGIKLLVKSLSDEVRESRNFLKTIKMESEKVPCPQGHVHRIFSAVHLIARHIGKKEPSSPHEFTVSWNAMKLYAVRFLGESPQRLRSLMDLMLKLKMADFKCEKNEDGEEEPSTIRFTNIQLCEDFAEFHQYHVFKGGRSEAIFVDPLAMKLARVIGEVSAAAPVDHKGASGMDFKVMIQECKAKGVDLKIDHFALLEKKGLFVKRQNEGETVKVSFDRKEFVNFAQFWAILTEIDKWNKNGSVNLNEKEEKVEAANGCPQCQKNITDQQKFCPECGYKLAAA